MDFSAEGPSPGDFSAGAEVLSNQSNLDTNPEQIQQRSSRGNNNSNSSDQDPSHRGGGKRNEDLSQFPTQEELKAHTLPIAEPIEETATSQTVELQRGEIKELRTAVEQFQKTGKADLEAVKFAQNVILPQQGLSQEEIERLGPRGTMEILATSQDVWEQFKPDPIPRPEDDPTYKAVTATSKDFGRVIDQEIKRQLAQQATAESSDTDRPTVQPQDTENLSATPVVETSAVGENLTPPTTSIQAETPEESDQDPLTASARGLVSGVVNPGDKLGDLTYSKEGNSTLGDLKFRVYTSEDGQILHLTPEEELAKAKGVIEKQNQKTETAATPTADQPTRADAQQNGPLRIIKGAPEQATPDANPEVNKASTTEAKTKTTEAPQPPLEVSQRVMNLLDRIEKGGKPGAIIAPETKDALRQILTPEQFKDYEERMDWQGALKELAKARTEGRVKLKGETATSATPSPTETTEPKGKGKKAKAKPSIPPAAADDKEPTVAERSAKIDQLIKEAQTKKETQAEPVVPETPVEKAPRRSSRLVSAAERARAKTAEKLRAAALKTPGGKFLYRTAEGYLNNFDWRDKNKVAWVAGIATGFGTNTALNIVLPGVGSLVNSAASTAATHLFSAGINYARIRSIERIIRTNVKALNSGNLKTVDVVSFRNQYDKASQLLGKGGLEVYQAEMARISNDLLKKLGLEPDEKHQYLVESLSQELQQKTFKYRKANERVRSFAAGMKVGAVTQGITDRFFNVENFVKDRISGPEAPNLGIGEGTPTEVGPNLSQEQIDLIREIHQDPEAWKTFTSLTPEQWEDVGRLYEAGRLAEAGIDAHPLIDQLASSEIGNLVETHRGDTVSSVLENNGHQVTWTASDADLFGGHIIANHDLLDQMQQKVIDTGISAEAVPTDQEVLTLMEQARGGDAVALHKLQQALYWIPADERFRVLSPNEIEEIASFFERKARLANQ